jgi:hypothetical protein
MENTSSFLQIFGRPVIPLSRDKAQFRTSSQERFDYVAD